MPIASGRGDAAAIAIRQRGAVLWGGRLQPAETVRVPDNAFSRLSPAASALEDAAGTADTAPGDAVR